MRRRRSSFKDTFSEELHINLTPLIDVVFVVLIMFIIIAPIVELDRVQLANAAIRSSHEMAAVEGNNPISIHVHADNTIWFNSHIISEKELIAVLQAAKKKTPTVIPQLFHDKKAQFGTYQMIKNAVELSGFEQMDVILQPG